MEDASACSTVSGSIAPVAMPLGQVQRRIPNNMLTGIMTNDLTPNTPDSYKKYKRKK